MGFRVDDMVYKNFICFIFERVSRKSTCEKKKKKKEGLYQADCRLVVTDVPFEFHPAYHRYISLL